MNKIIIATDSYKGTISAEEACEIIAEEALAVFPEAELVKMPIADGGEGLVESLLAEMEGELVWVDTLDPLGRPIRASYAMLEGGAALIEMAAAAGLPLIAETEKDPSQTSTYGVGLMILDALQRGASPIYIGLGGSATVDGGTGAASAMGIRFEDEAGQPITNGGGLQKIVQIHHQEFDQLALAEKITFLLDVDNPLCGPDGAAAIYGPQKGASQEQIWDLDQGLHNLANLIDQETGLALRELSGIGAAGGFALPFLAYANARMVSGIDFVLDTLGFEEKLEGAQILITGEGRTDAQSAMGKAISAVASRAHRLGVRVAVISGLLGEGADNMFALGVDDLLQATPEGQELDEALANAKDNLRFASRQFFEWLMEERSQVEDE